MALAISKNIDGLRLYISRQASSIQRYVLEQTVCGLIGWLPTVVGITVRALVYRLILRMDGIAAIENKVRLRFANNIRLGPGVYLDQETYLHACPSGIDIGEGTFVMHGSVLHVYNFRNLPHAGIRIGRQSLIGEYNVIRGQGGISIGDRVYTSPRVQLLAVDHVFDDCQLPFVEQGITAAGITIEDDVWIGAGAVVADGVRIGKGSVVGAGAVVVRDVPPHTLVAGVPARVVREIASGSQRRRRGPVFFSDGTVQTHEPHEPKVETEPASVGELGTPTTLSVVIPALNEEASISDIVRRVKAVEEGLRDVGIDCAEVIVVDDGSRDRTAEIVGRLSGVRLIRHRTTLGYGAALKSGFCHARGELLAFLDADGTYPPEHLPLLCHRAIEEKADIVVGSRRSGTVSHMPPVRRIGNLLWSSIISFLGGSRYADPASGMRILRRDVLPRLYPLPDGLNFTPVMSTRAIHESLKLVEVPIPYFERAGRSKLSIVDDGMRFLKTILWTALEYNPAKILGLVGVIFSSLAFLIGAGIGIMRLSGITTLGPWGAFSVFVALVLAVSGVSIYSLGITFNFFVSLFHRQPMRRGLFASSALENLIEPYLGRIGACSIIAGIAFAAVSMMHIGGDWDINRLWLWLLGSALFFLAGLQLVISWVAARVLERLAERESMVDRELHPDENLSATPQAPDYAGGGLHPIGVPGTSS